MRLLPIVALSLSFAAHAGKPIEATVAVVDAAGKPIPHAVVVFDDEGERHNVHADRGDWRGDGLYLPDSSHVPFAKGQEVPFAVAAAGYQANRSALQVDSRKPTITVTLQPVPAPSLPCVPDGVILTSEEALDWAREQLGLPPEQVDDLGCVHGVQAVAAHHAWARAAKARLEEHSEDTYTIEWNARERANAAARDWMAWAADADADAAHAKALCQAAADRLAPCE